MGIVFNKGAGQIMDTLRALIMHLLIPYVDKFRFSPNMAKIIREN